MRHLIAVFYMLGAATIWAMVPAVMDFTEGVQSPFLFSGGFRLGGSLGCLLFLVVLHRGLLCEFGKVLASTSVTGVYGDLRREVVHLFCSALVFLRHGVIGQLVSFSL
jgi:hypothetical protein